MKTIRQCEAGCGRPVRKRRGARWCSPCVARLEKRRCEPCGLLFHPDMMATGNRCRGCNREKAHDKRVGEIYGLAPGQYAELLEFQGGVSAIAGMRPVAKRLAVDHDHTTGEVRGLLTKHENFYVLGWLEKFDDPFKILDAIAAYLKNPPARRLWGDAVPKQKVSR